MSNSLIRALLENRHKIETVVVYIERWNYTPEVKERNWERQSYRQLDIQYMSLLKHVYSQEETHPYPQHHTNHYTNFHLQEPLHRQGLSSSLFHPARIPPGEDSAFLGCQGEQPTGMAIRPLASKVFWKEGAPWEVSQPRGQVRAWCDAQHTVPAGMCLGKAHSAVALQQE